MSEKNESHVLKVVFICIVVFTFLFHCECYSTVCSVGGNGEGCWGGESTSSSIKAEIKSRTRRSVPMSLLKRARSKGSESKALRGETLPFAIESTYDFAHTLEGDWPDVCGYVCFKIWDEYTNKDMYVCIIGLDTVALGNNEYASRGWDKQVFWMDIGADAPLFVCGIYAPNYVEEGVECDNVFWAPNITYRDPETEEVYWTDLWMYLDDEDEVEEAWIVLYDEDGEEIDEWELEEGRRNYFFRARFSARLSDDICSATIERDFQVVRKRTRVFLRPHDPKHRFPQSVDEGQDRFRRFGPILHFERRERGRQRRRPVRFLYGEKNRL